MDALDKWLIDQTSTPAGSVILFLAVFMARILIDRWDRRRAAKKAAHRRIPHGG